MYKRQAKKDDVSLKEAFGVTLKNKTLVMLGIGVGLGNMVYSSMVAWIPMFLVREMGWTSAEVGAYMSPVYLFTGIVTVSYTHLADRGVLGLACPESQTAAPGRRAVFAAGAGSGRESAQAGPFRR